jgi:hypothetical protein
MLQKSIFRVIMVTIGQRRLGKTIRKLENSVEFSPKECKAKVADKKYQSKINQNNNLPEDSPVQNLRSLVNKKD